MHATVALWVGRGVLFREVSSFQRLHRKVPHPSSCLLEFFKKIHCDRNAPHNMNTFHISPSGVIHELVAMATPYKLITSLSDREGCGSRWFLLHTN